MLQCSSFLLFVTILSPTIGHTYVLSLPQVYTDLREASAQAVGHRVSSTAQQKFNPQNGGIDMGSAGANANDIGAATSYGVNNVGDSNTAVGLSAAGSASLSVMSQIIHSVRKIVDKSYSVLWRSRRWSPASAVVSLSSQGDVLNNEMSAGSTGVQAGPVATALSLGAALMRIKEGVAGVNAGATAAHAGKNDATTTFSNSQLGTGVKT